MEPRDVLAYLKRIPAFRDLEDVGSEELLRLVPFVQQRTFQPGETLLREESVPDRTLILVRGRVRVLAPEEGLDGRDEERGPGAVLGRTSLAVDDFLCQTVVALNETEVLLLPFRDLIKAYQKSKYLREHLEGPLKPGKPGRSLAAGSRRSPTSLTARANWSFIRLRRSLRNRSTATVSGSSGRARSPTGCSS